MHSSDINQVRFSMTKFRAGYEMSEVDAFLDSLQKSLLQWEAGRSGTILAGEVVHQRFSVTKFRNGYDQDQVDDFLDQATATLQVHEKGSKPGY